MSTASYATSCRLLRLAVAVVVLFSVPRTGRKMNDDGTSFPRGKLAAPLLTDTSGAEAPRGKKLAPSIPRLFKTSQRRDAGDVDDDDGDGDVSTKRARASERKGSEGRTDRRRVSTPAAAAVAAAPASGATLLRRADELSGKVRHLQGIPSHRLGSALNCVLLSRAALV